MNDTDIDFFLTRIMSGYLIFFYQGDRYELRYPTNKLKYEANLIYNGIINDEKYTDWIREENLTRVLIMLGLWDNKTEKDITQLEKQTENLKVDIYNNFLNKDIREKSRNHLRSTENQLNRILNIKSDFAGNTLEGYAASIKNEFIVCNTLYKNNKLVFSLDDVKDNTSYQYFNNLVNEINQYIIPIKTYKFLARSSTWRSYWNCNKDNIFNAQVIDWTDEQRSLVNITKMYDNVYEHPECPDDKLIEDDDALEGWFVVQKRKAAKIKTQNNLDNSNPNLKKAQEIFLISSDQESKESILSLNNPEALHRMKEKFEFISATKDKEIDDLSLPDVQRNAREQLARSQQRK